MYLLSDEAISTNHAPYHVNQEHDVEDVTQAREQVNIGPITRSRAKKLQQEVNALLCKIHFNINENCILSKSCMLLLLRFTKEDDKNTEGEDYREGPHSNPSSAAEQSERISHNFWFPKAMVVNEDIFGKLIKSTFQWHTCRVLLIIQ